MPVITTGLSASSNDRALALSVQAGLKVQPLWLRGRRYWALKDPVTLRYYQLRDEEYFVLRLLDGRTSLEDIRVRFEREFAPRRLSIGQLHAFLGNLHTEGLLVSDRHDQGQQLLERRGRIRRRAVLDALSNLLALRVRGVDPERFLNWLYPKCRWLLSRWFLSFCLLLVVAAASLVVLHGQTLRARLPEFATFFNLRNAVWFAVAITSTKFLHEMGHALTCKHFGGECHELGLMFLVFTPCLYCNVSDAWMFPGKWQRAAVGAAGMCVEVVLAAACTLLWWFSEPGLLNSLCLKIMFVCSVSTLLFNGNPLLRYDGYFILSDLIEVPNLQQQSTAVVRNALAQWWLGLDLETPGLLPTSRRGWLALYAIAATAYRWVLAIAILWFIYHVLKPLHLEVLAQILTLATVTGLVGVPLVQAVQFMLQPINSRRVKWTRAIIVTTVVGGALLLAGLVPLPYHLSAPAVLQPRDAVSVYVTAPGRLKDSVPVGAVVQAGQTLAQLENLDVTLEVAKLRGERDHQQLHVLNLERRRVADPAAELQLPGAREALADLEERLRQRLADQQRLTLTAPVSGTVLPPPEHNVHSNPGELHGWTGSPLDQRNADSFLETGTTFCLIGDPRRMEAVLVVDQADVDLICVGQHVRLRLDQFPGETWEGTVTEVAEIDVKIAPRELAQSGELASKPDESGVERPASTSYQARVTLDESAERLRSGASGQGRIEAQPQSLFKRLGRYLSRTFRFDS